MQDQGEVFQVAQQGLEEETALLLEPGLDREVELVE